MNILSAKYYTNMDGETAGIIVTTPETVEPDGIGNKMFTICVPIDSANSDYAEIMRQVEAGELVIQEAE